MSELRIEVPASTERQRVKNTASSAPRQKSRSQPGTSQPRRSLVSRRGRVRARPARCGPRVLDQRPYSCQRPDP